MPDVPFLARAGLAALIGLAHASGAIGGGLSESYRVYYAGLEADLVARGRLRTDRGSAATDAASLARDFVEVALHEEYAGGALSRGMGRRAAKPLQRWEDPVRMQVVFGASVPDTRRAEDRGAIRAYAARLSAITGHPVATVAEDANFHILVVNEDERRSLARQLPELIPGISPWMVRTILSMQKTHLCMVVTEPHADPRRGKARAVAILRAEHDGRLRRACLEEEIAQGLGLSNDCETADPTIFSDTFDYASLTRRDEVLLKMLYHPSLASGMSHDEALPTITRLAEAFTRR